MGVYFIANIRIYDENEYNKYVKSSEQVFKKYRGKYLTVDNNPTVLEGKWDYSRVVLIEFPDRESLDEWYQSVEYQFILQYRLNAAECDTIIAESGE